MVIIFVTISSLLVPKTVTKFSQSFCVERFKTIIIYDFFNAAKTILSNFGRVLFHISAIFFHFRQAKPIASARLPRYEIRQWRFFPVNIQTLIQTAFFCNAYIKFLCRNFYFLSICFFILLLYILYLFPIDIYAKHIYFFVLYFFHSK